MLSPDAIVVRDARIKGPISRRAFLTASLAVSVGGSVAIAAGTAVDFLYPRTKTETLIANLRDLAPGTKIAIAPDGRSTSSLLPDGRKVISPASGWLVSLTAAQGGPGLLALLARCSHHDGAGLAWLPNYHFFGASPGHDHIGWFMCSRCDSTFDDDGRRVFGPAPRSMDRLALHLDGDDIYVDFNRITPGTKDNAAFALKLPPPAAES